MSFGTCPSVRPEAREPRSASKGLDTEGVKVKGRGCFKGDQRGNRHSVSVCGLEDTAPRDGVEDAWLASEAVEVTDARLQVGFHQA